jgi:hypothetical protein
VSVSRCFMAAVRSVWMRSSIVTTRTLARDAALAYRGWVKALDHGGANPVSYRFAGTVATSLQVAFIISDSLRRDREP